MKTLADRMKYARTFAGLTQRDVGDALKVTRNAVSLWENGTNAPTADKLGEFAKMTGISVEWIMVGGPIDKASGSPRSKIDDELSQYVDTLQGTEREKALALLKIGIGK